MPSRWGSLASLGDGSSKHYSAMPVVYTKQCVLVLLLPQESITWSTLFSPFSNFVSSDVWSPAAVDFDPWSSFSPTTYIVIDQRCNSLYTIKRHSVNERASSIVPWHHFLITLVQLVCLYWQEPPYPRSIIQSLLENLNGFGMELDTAFSPWSAWFFTGTIIHLGIRSLNTLCFLGKWNDQIF